MIQFQKSQAQLNKEALQDVKDNKLSKEEYAIRWTGKFKGHRRKLRSMFDNILKKPGVWNTGQMNPGLSAQIMNQPKKN